MTMRIMMVIAFTISLLTPFIQHNNPALALNTYDLAEWSGLLPQERNTTPPLLVAAALRFQMFATGILLLSLTIRSVIPRNMFILCVIVVTLLQLPPPMEFISNLNDINYQQQLILALLTPTLLAITTYIQNRSNDYANYLLLLLPSIAFLALLYAISQLANYFTQYQINASLTVTPFALGAGYILAFLVIIQTKRAPQRSFSVIPDTL